MGKRHEVMQWRRLASLLPNNSNVTCSESRAMTDDTYGPLMIRRPESSMILRRSLPELRGSARMRTRHLQSWFHFSPVVSMSCGVFSLAHRLQ
jgi:hypothetical protein